MENSPEMEVLCNGKKLSTNEELGIYIRIYIYTYYIILYINIIWCILDQCSGKSYTLRGYLTWIEFSIFNPRGLNMDLEYSTYIYLIHVSEAVDIRIPNLMEVPSLGIYQDSPLGYQCSLKPEICQNPTVKWLPSLQFYWPDDIQWC